MEHITTVYYIHVANSEQRGNQKQHITLLDPRQQILSGLVCTIIKQALEDGAARVPTTGINRTVFTSDRSLNCQC